jgi:hypothetical protein
MGQLKSQSASHLRKTLAWIIVSRIEGSKQSAGAPGNRAAGFFAPTQAARS